MCAGLISDGQLYNEKKVDKYLEIAFRSEKGEQLIKDSFDELEKALGEKASKLLAKNKRILRSVIGIERRVVSNKFT